MREKTVAFHNLGCKVNAYETDAMQEQLEAAGYTIVPFSEQADIYVINTCTVTNIADRKSRQMLHRAKKKNPDSVVVAVGCYVQAQTDAGQAIEDVDVIVGNNEKKNLAVILDRALAEGTGLIKKVIDISRDGKYEELFISRTAGHTRAYMKIQDGCNQFCSYCIIPFARGRVRSRDVGQIIAEARQLAKAGYQEIVLTGIHLSSYGMDFTGEEAKRDLLYLIQKVHEVEGIRRIRLGSLEPRVMTEQFVRSIAGLSKVCPHFHLSLQSGCDETLARMNRRYTTAEYREKCDLLRTCFENPALTTDVIVGFPGETEEEFAKSSEFVNQIGFYETHIFKYSKRRGTKAATMPGQVDDESKTNRSKHMQELNQAHREAYETSLLGVPVEVLVERPVVIDGIRCQEGHTREYVRVAIPGQNGENKIVKTTIEKNSQILH